MLKFISILTISLLLATSLPAQLTCDIRVKMSGYNTDTLWFGSTYGKRAEPDFHALKGADGYFQLVTDKPLAPGLYAIIFKKGGSQQFMSCWLAEGQRSFTIETDFFRMASSTTVKGSAENEVLYDYFRRYYALTDSLDDLTNHWKSMQDEPSFRAYVQGQEALRQYQEAFLEKHPNSLTAELVRQTLFLTPPQQSELHADWQSEAAERHAFLRQHYFDRMDLSGGQFLKYPLWVDRTDYYFSKLPPPVPDSLAAMVEDVLNRLQPNVEAYQYYVGYVMNSLAKMSRFRTDEAFVRLVRTHLDGGKWGFLSEDRQRRYRDDADRMEPLFVGKKCPAVTLYDRDAKPVPILDVPADYTLLLFWLYDCGHCKKEIPVVKNLHEKYKAKGLKVLSVCGKSGEEETHKCWEFTQTMQMPEDWLLLNDPQRKSRFSTLLNVRSYPRMILLDKEKNIVYKQIGEVPEVVLERELVRVVR
ncbi:MAG: redoxin domain-containing protein [Saprospiraceae bacterium]|nr:redoxin domain-containing protein [Saprospiraceae bacterium]